VDWLIDISLSFLFSTFHRRRIQINDYVIRTEIRVIITTSATLPSHFSITSIIINHSPFLHTCPFSHPVSDHEAGLLIVFTVLIVRLAAPL
jgi:hypothetical protein